MKSLLYPPNFSCCTRAAFCSKMQRQPSRNCYKEALHVTIDSAACFRCNLVLHWTWTSLARPRRTFGSATNGHFMELLQLIAKCDPFLASHIVKQCNTGSGWSSYLSSSACEELIDLVAQTILAEVIREIKKSVYYSVSINSTPDVSCVDQLTCYSIWYRPVLLNVFWHSWNFMWEGIPAQHWQR